MTHVRKLLETLKGVITNGGGTVDNVNEWGLREFAYEIQDFKKGYYTILDVTAPAAAVIEFDRIARINANVITSDDYPALRSRRMVTC